MRNIIAFLFMLSAIPVFGQNHYIGMKGGINLTNVISDDFFIGNGVRYGINGGLTYEYKLENKFNIGLDLVYAQKGFTEDLIFTDETGATTGGELAFKYNYDYVSIPIKGGYSIGNNFEGFLNLGVVPSMLFKAQTISPAFPSLPGSTYDVSNSVTKFDLGGLIEIGGSYKFNEFLFFTSVAYQQSFISFTNVNYFANSTARHHGMTLSLGLKYALTNN